MTLRLMSASDRITATDPEMLQVTVTEILQQSTPPR